MRLDMITAETIYEKAKTLDSHTLQEVANFVDFLKSKQKSHKAKQEMRQFFPQGTLESHDQKPPYTEKVLSIEDMDAAIEYEAGQQK